MTTLDDTAVLGGDRVAERMLHAERILADVTGAHGDALASAAAGTLSAGGKRLRPLLVLLCAGDAEGDAPTRAAGAVELVHTATLVHDDVIDRASLRRGRETVFAARGRATATATGDFVFSRAFELLAQNRDREQVRVLADACLALAVGELAQRRDAYRADVSPERYVMRCRLKTASLFAAACRLGALTADRGAPDAGALEAFGQDLGVAFQMLDDLLDVTGPPSRTGKHRGTDLLDGTVTLPLILARREDAALARLDLRTVTTRAEAERVCDRIAGTGALGETRAQAAALLAGAKETVRGAVGQELERTLHSVADRVAERYA